MTNPKKEEFLKLVDKYLDKVASKEEIDDVEAYYTLFSEAPDVLETIAEFDLTVTAQRLKNRISEKIRDEENKSKPTQDIKVKPLWYRFAGVAIVLLAIGAGFYFYTSRTSSSDVKNLEVTNEISPGVNKATLTLADGKKLELKDAVYTVAPAATQNRGKVSYNILSTPRGGQYQIKLPDGSRIWLNSETIVKFPVNFDAGADRIIELQGEAYFEVAKMESTGHLLPFIVETRHQRITVLGTHFNVNSYENEDFTKTTLLEGSVRVNGNSGSEVVLKPNEQAALSAKGIQVIQVDTDQVIAWKNGKFDFVSEDIESIMRKIARWYDVEVIYKDELPNKQFSGSFSRFEDVSSVLRTIERTNTVHFKIEGRRILVMK